MKLSFVANGETFLPVVTSRDLLDFDQLKPKTRAEDARNTVAFLTRSFKRADPMTTAEDALLDLPLHELRDLYVRTLHEAHWGRAPSPDEPGA